MHLLSANVTYDRPDSISGEIGYARMQMCTTPDDVYQWVSSIVRDEKSINSTDRPSKVFLTIGAMARDWKGSRNINHDIVVVIEPDSRNHDKARITIVNPVGNEEHAEYEDAAIRAIQQSYSSRASRTVKNKKIQQYDPDGCGLHAIENIAVLKDVPNVQRFIEAGRLPDRTPDMVTRVYGVHARIAHAVYEWIRNPLTGKYTVQPLETAPVPFVEDLSPVELNEMAGVPDHSSEVDKLKRAVSVLLHQVQSKKFHSDQGIHCKKKRYNDLCHQWKRLSLSAQDKKKILADLKTIHSCIQRLQTCPNAILAYSDAVKVAALITVGFLYYFRTLPLQTLLSLTNRNIQMIQQG